MPDRSLPRRLLNSAETEQLFEILSGFIDPHCELNHTTAFELLIAVVLSAQATDASVNRVTANLWKDCHSPQDYIDLGEAEVAERIRTIGLYRNKAKSLVNLCHKLLTDFQGEVPHTREELMSLPGVGRKTANVVLNVWFKQPTLAVDTHVFRVSNRVGLVRTTTPEATELDLLKVVPEAYLLHAHHYILLLGRYTCTARNPKCDQCPVRHICRSQAEGLEH